MTTNKPVSAEEIAALASEAEQFALNVREMARTMEKRFTADPGDALLVLSQLSGLSLDVASLMRMVVFSARMREQAQEIETRVKTKRGKDQ